MENYFESDYNRNLKEALSEAARDYSEENWLKVVELLMEGLLSGEELAIASNGAHRIVIAFDTDIEAEDIFSDEPGVDEERLASIDHDGKSWLLTFTCAEEAYALDSNANVMYIPIRELFEFLCGDEEVGGFIINLGTDTFLVSRELMADMLEDADDWPDVG